MASVVERFERPVGSIDGANRAFQTDAEFVPATLRVWLNGLLVRGEDEDGWEVTGVATFEMRRAPVAGDTLLCRYVEA